MTDAEREQLATKTASLGGAARAKSLTPAQRKKIAKAAAKARWAKGK
jgi:hypothetical protein